MKKTYTISLGGRIFHLEEDAVDKLQSYISVLEKHYSKEQDGNEIMSDIEGRIAELFEEYMQEPLKEVITLADVDRMMAIMGSPSDIIDEDASTEEAKSPRKLYRDLDRSILGGVSAGIATYFNIPVILVRLCFILFTIFYGITILVYLVLWIGIPAALTSRQKLEMKGAKINIPNLEKNVKESFNQIKNSGKVEKICQKAGHTFSEVLNALGNAIYKIGDILLKVIAVLLIVLAILILIPLTQFFIFYPLSIQDLEWLNLPVTLSPFYLNVFRFSLMFSLLTPLLLLIWLCVIALIPIKKKKLLVTGILAGIWILSLTFMFFSIISQRAHFNQEARNVQYYELPVRNNQLYIKMQQTYPFQEENTEDVRYLPEIEFETTNREEPEIVVTQKAKAYFEKKARQKAKKLSYKWTLKNDTLILDNYFHSPYTYNGEEVKLRIRIPENYSVFLDSTLQYPLSRFPSWSTFEGTHKNYVATKTGLIRTNK